ncbi:MAG: hypothetical protein IAI50_17965 [Candidatus Eremiobacteraeota bacterium]|nr:hypothetical protein [Candidatus Eremiobacteraeota bacterium]
MAYEYGARSAQFEIPNPHRVENYFFYFCGALCFIAAVAALLFARGHYAVREYASFARALTVGVVLLGAALVYAIQAMKQMRFFFGRGQPADLVPHLDTDQIGYVAGGNGQVADARALRETIRQNAITYAIPRSPIDTLLYSQVKELIFSPRLTQRLVQTQFRNVLALVFLILCFSVSIAGVGNGAAVAWIAALYFIVTLVLVLRPLASGTRSTGFSVNGLVGFVAGSIIGPVILASVIPQHAYPLNDRIAFIPITYLVLFAALSVSGLLLVAGIRNTVMPNTISAAPHLETPSMNATPSQIFTELSREMQRLWVEQVPNRTYMRIPPLIEGNQGSFDANLIEETQPLAQDIAPITLASAFALETTRWLLMTDFVGAAFTTAGVFLLLNWAFAPHALDSIIYGASLTIVGAFAFRGANRMWRRFEFKSRLYWVECNGNFSRASASVGTYLQDRVHSTRELINVETMTLRVWVVEVDSVAFDAGTNRDMVSLRGLPDEAERICRHLATFAVEQPSVIVPSSTVDLQRLAVMDAINPRTSNGNGIPVSLQGPPPGPTAVAPAQPAPQSLARKAALRYCVTCGKPDTEGSPFCGGCGSKFGS